MKPLAAAAAAFLTVPLLALSLLVPVLAGGVQADQHATQSATYCINRGQKPYPPVGLGGQPSSTQAARQPQRSAFPDVYDRHEPVARAIVADLEAATSSCAPAETGVDCPATPSSVGSEYGQTSDAVMVMRCVAAGWPQIRTIGGLRPGDPRDHGSGRAVDVIIPNWRTPTGRALGQQIAEWAHANAHTFGVTYVIWDRKIWSQARNPEGWRPCSTGACYAGPDPSAAHLDHVHISVAGNQYTGPTAPGDSRAVLPVAKGSYRISAYFGQSGSRWASTHTGLDFAARAGTPIRAVTAGTVVSARSTGGPWGNLTKIQASDGTQVWYAHQSRMTVTEGQQVTAGQPIGAVGATGNASGPHLHLEIRNRGRPVDPLTWLRDQGLQP
ncbi:M23 family metallopeptidase [Tessaracoccus sp. OS52]|uniref:M23 family metallopeptidase n=1 Tax=Tessaracoccus sp. OS52 TaxID=2886691 RepID=UPI001D12CBB5|nr:M23 family metallopeptidase [Tessaracoccus sp. OS52]MCC2592543.1 M23 family metallopeptidase [Tessaracoccus sp. OS52]